MTPARKLTVEFIGTLFLMFTVGMAVHSAGSLAPLAIGALLMVMVFTGGHISDGHHNPAVSPAVSPRRKLASRDYPPYIVTQVIGAILAGLLIRGLGDRPHSPVAVAGTGKMLIAEFLFTFALCWVVLNVATANDTVHQRANGRIPPAQGLRQARHHLARTTRTRPLQRPERGVVARNRTPGPRVRPSAGAS